MHQKWSTKFEIKPGRWVFVPTVETLKEGIQIKDALESHWKPPNYYFHLRAGGHVKAMQLHMNNLNFLKIDIQDFFGSINSSRVTRCLKRFFSYNNAREYAQASTVKDPNNSRRVIIPFGFVQSQILASLCLQESALGVYLQKLNKNEAIKLSVYVDDIIVSASSLELLKQILQELEDAALKANFTLNTIKQEGPASKITAFNLDLALNSLQVEEKRYQLFKQEFAATENLHVRRGIASYIQSINLEQSFQLSV
jgi:hypothetical protein